MRVKNHTVSAANKKAFNVGEATVLNFEALITEAKEDPVWNTGKLYSRALLKDQDLRIVLIGIHEGSAIEMHESESTVSLQVLEGSLILATGEKLVYTQVDELYTVIKGEYYGLSAKAPTLFLMTKAV
jgi:hypothetical protein